MNLPLLITYQANTSACDIGAFIFDKEMIKENRFRDKQEGQRQGVFSKIYGFPRIRHYQIGNWAGYCPANCKDQTNDNYCQHRFLEIATLPVLCKCV